MKRKEYQKPAMQLVQLQHRTHLLQASGPKQMEKPQDYENGGDPFSF